MKVNKTIIITIITIVLLVVAIIIGIKLADKQEDNNNLKKEDLPIQEQVKNGTAEKQGDYTLTELNISSSGSLNVVKGKLTNTSNDTKNVEIKLLMSNSQKGQLLGTTTKIIENVEPNQTVEFDISLVGSYKDMDTYEIRANQYVASNNSIEEVTE